MVKQAITNQTDSEHRRRDPGQDLPDWEAPQLVRQRISDVTGAGPLLKLGIEDIVYRSS